MADCVLPLSAGSNAILSSRSVIAMGETAYVSQKLVSKPCPLVNQSRSFKAGIYETKYHTKKSIMDVPILLFQKEASSCDDNDTWVLELTASASQRSI